MPMPRSITHGDVFLAYFNKIWGIPITKEESTREVPAEKIEPHAKHYILCEGKGYAEGMPATVH
jgi:hypothetical protein